MSSPYGPMLLIANPAAGRGRDAILPRLRDALTDRGLEHDVATTRGPGHAIRLARDAVTEQGIRFVVAVGGDGTLHEVVNGLVDPEEGPRAPDAVLGVVPAGSGSDFTRTFGLDRKPEILAQHLDGETVFGVDLGRVRLIGRDGTEQTRLFANIAEAGFGAEVTDRANGLPRPLGPLRYPAATLLSLRRFSLTEATVTIDHTEITEPTSMVIVANAQFFGGGMKVAPRALPDDGLFNVQIWRGSATDVVRMFPKARSGDHLGTGDVREYQSATVRLDGAEPMLIEADGEVLGTTPATFDILPKALRLKI